MIENAAETEDPRREPLETLVRCMREFVFSRVRKDEPAGETASKIFASLERRAEPLASISPRRFPVCDRIDDAIRAIPDSDEHSLAVASAIKTLDPHLGWYRREGSAADPVFETGHANAMLVGPGGLEARDNVWLGVSIMAPGITYPKHRHPPDEIYAVLSPGEWWRADGEWWEPGIGGIVYNSSNVMHAMRSDKQCLLAAWCLWAEQ